MGKTPQPAGEERAARSVRVDRCSAIVSSQTGAECRRRRRAGWSAIIGDRSARCNYSARSPTTVDLGGCVQQAHRRAVDRCCVIEARACLRECHRRGREREDWVDQDDLIGTRRSRTRMSPPVGRQDDRERQLSSAITIAVESAFAMRPTQPSVKRASTPLSLPSRRGRRRSLELEC